MKLITQILHKYQDALGHDYHAYHNHAQRVYQYAITLLLQRESKKLAISAAFHDLDIWVGHTMDYLKGSRNLARAYLADSDFLVLPDEIAFIIDQHHKLTKIKGNLEADAFRKADLIDLTAGLVSYNLPKSLIQETEKHYTRHNFSQLIASKFLKNVILHPLKPFPMIRW